MSDIADILGAYEAEKRAQQPQPGGAPKFSGSGVLRELDAMLEEQGIEAAELRPTRGEANREGAPWYEKATAGAYNAARGYNMGFAEVAAAPVELAGILTGSKALRDVAGAVRGAASHYDERMMEGGQPLVEPGLLSDVAQGLGSAGSFVYGGAAMGGASRVLGAGGKALGQASRLNRFADVALGTTMAGHAARLGAMTQAQAQFRDAEVEGADPLQKWGALLGGAAIGATEGLAIGGTGQFARAAKALESIDTRSGGAMSNMLRRGLVSLGTEGMEEATQEGFQTFSEAMLAQQILKYAAIGAGAFLFLVALISLIIVLV